MTEPGTGLTPKRAVIRNSGEAGIVVSLLEITDLQRMEAERQVIFEVIHALNQTSNLDQLLRHIHQSLKKVLYAENCFIAMHDAETRIVPFSVLRRSLRSAPPPQKVGRSCTAFVFRTGRGMLDSASRNSTAWRPPAM